MKKITLEICCGTTCYLLGAAELLKIGEIMPPEWQSRVEIVLSPCLGTCLNEELGGAPFVKLNGEVISRAGVEMLMSRLKGLVEHA